MRLGHGVLFRRNQRPLQGSQEESERFATKFFPDQAGHNLDNDLRQVPSAVALLTNPSTKSR